MSDEVEVLVELLTEFLGDFHQHYESKGQISFDCPVCAEEKGLDGGDGKGNLEINYGKHCLLYTSPSPRDRQKSRMPSSA